MKKVSPITRHLSGKEGQTLIEVVVALAVAIVVILALVRVTVTSIRNADFARNRTLATKYAQEALEKVRLHRDENSWQDFINDCNNKTIPLESPPLPDPFALSPPDCYRPEIIPQQPCVAADNSCEVKITISWRDAQGIHKSELKTRLAKWK